MKITFPVFFLIFISIFLASCQSVVAIHATANKRINPDVQRNNPEPVSIQIYQLKDPKKFNEASYFQITDEPEKTLGSDFLAPMVSFMISPNQKLDIDIKLNSDAKYFGLVAAFQAIDNSKWKSIVSLEGKQKKDISILLKDRNLFINSN